MSDGLFAGTYNFESRSSDLNAGAKDSKEYILLSQLPIPPHYEVYVAIHVADDAGHLETGLKDLYSKVQARNQAAAQSGGKQGKINNNLKIYIDQKDGILLSNDFPESIADGKSKQIFSANLPIRPNAIYFSVWPNSPSVVRSSIVREFIAFLGDLVGREKVHELRAWADSTNVPSTARRLPKTISLDEIEESIRGLGGHYPNGEVARFHSALNFHPSKHFAILSGLSGTGKTQLALKYAKAVHGITSAGERDPFLFVCPVRPEWTDPSGLTGYYDVLSDRYIVPTFLDAVLVALSHPDSPVFVVLDELNLARVEYYFSDLLSSMETGEELQLHSSEVPLNGSTGTKIPATIPLPINLYIVGTINIDETTNPISDKVLDRAHIIDMSEIDLEGFFNSLPEREPDLEAAIDAVGPRVKKLHEIMSSNSAGFGYRVAEEVVRYYQFSESIGQSSNDIMDGLVVQKILSKLRGTERQRGMLTELKEELNGFPRSEALLEGLLGDLNEFGSFQTNR